MATGLRSRNADMVASTGYDSSDREWIGDNHKEAVDSFREGTITSCQVTDTTPFLESRLAGF